MAINKSCMTLIAVFVLFSTRISHTESQAVETCASKLVPCALYLNSSNPPANCCDPIKDAVAHELPCLCNLYKNPEVLKSFGVNLTQALALTSACGVSTDISSCNGTAAQSPPATTPPSVPGNDGRRVAWTGLYILLFIWVSMIVY